MTELQAPPDQPSTDLTTRADVEALLRRFYGRVLVDDVLAEPFAELRIRGLDSHIPVMCDFWETVLFRAGLYRGSALHAHRHVHHRDSAERASLRLLADHVEQHRRRDVPRTGRRTREDPSRPDRLGHAPAANRAPTRQNSTRWSHAELMSA